MSINLQISAEFLALVKEKKHPEVATKAIKRLEREADKITKECIDLLHKTFITPIDRDQIYQLVNGLDDFADQMNAATFRLFYYDIEELRPDTLEFAKVIQNSVLVLDDAIKSLRIPNFITIQRIFRKGNYDRILCSTEGPMGLVALYLKQLYPVKTYFYLHTDWTMFAKQVIDLEEAGLNRLERLMRIYYNRFDRIFVLNTDQQKWLTGHTMRFNPSRILMTAHWVDESFSRQGNSSEIIGCKKENPVMLFAGRLSREKGIFELPEIFRKARERILNLHMIIAGTGPNEKELRAVFPEAEFKGWIDHDQLPELFASADLLVLPSRFDTFSCAVLEALSCGLPVIAYNTKGPKDIIRDKVNGFLVETPDEMVYRVTEYFSDERMQVEFKQAAFTRARDYSADQIMNQLLKDIEISTFPM